MGVWCAALVSLVMGLPPSSVARAAFTTAASRFGSSSLRNLYSAASASRLIAAQFGPAAVILAADELVKSGVASAQTTQALSLLIASSDTSNLHAPIAPTFEEMCNRLRHQVSLHVMPEEEQLHRKLRAMTISTQVVDTDWLTRAASVLGVPAIIWRVSQATQTYELVDFSMQWGLCECVSAINILRSADEQMFVPLVPRRDHSLVEEMLQSTPECDIHLPNVNVFRPTEQYPFFDVCASLPYISSVVAGSYAQASNALWMPTHSDVDEIVVVDGQELNEYADSRAAISTRLHISQQWCQEFDAATPAYIAYIA